MRLIKRLEAAGDVSANIVLEDGEAVVWAFLSTSPSMPVAEDLVNDLRIETAKPNGEEHQCLCR